MGNHELGFQDNPGLYKITNSVNDKIYIGSTINVRKRIICHKSKLNKNNHHNKKLQYSWNKYGSDVFHFEVIKYLPKEKLKPEEQRMLDMLFPLGILYNTFKDAYVLRAENHPMYGKRHSREARKKIKEARRKQVIKHSLETRNKISEGNKGRLVDMNHIIKMVNARNGTWNKGLTIKDERVKKYIEKRKIKFSEQEKITILSLYKSGLSIESIRKKIGVGWFVIKKLLIENNINTRNISQQKIITDEISRKNNKHPKC